MQLSFHAQVSSYAQAAQALDRLRAGYLQQITTLKAIKAAALPRPP
jgi:hypothetical protein